MELALYTDLRLTFTQAWSYCLVNHGPLAVIPGMQYASTAQVLVQQAQVTELPSPPAHAIVLPCA